MESISTHGTILSKFIYAEYEDEFRQNMKEVGYPQKRSEMADIETGRKLVIDHTPPRRDGWFLFSSERGLTATRLLSRVSKYLGFRVQENGKSRQRIGSSLPTGRRSSSKG
jgi:hypothetical protein